MVEDLKSLKDNLFKVLASRGQSDDDGDENENDSTEERGSSEGSFIDSKAARAIMSTIFARAGKGKDDVVQILAREIGMALAGMLKKPLSELAKNQKLQVSFEFVPKNNDSDEVSLRTSVKTQSKKTAKKKSRKTKTRK
jgi:hypothetical protein